jgi:hypothetical protein
MGQTNLRLPEQIYNRISLLTGFDSGTKSTIATKCGLARGNLQWPEILGLFSKPKISRSNFLVDLKVQSTRCDKQRTVRMFTKILRLTDFEIKTIFRFLKVSIRYHI